MAVPKSSLLGRGPQTKPRKRPPLFGPVSWELVHWALSIARPLNGLSTPSLPYSEPQNILQLSQATRPIAF